MKSTERTSQKVIPSFIPKPYIAADAIRILNTAQAAFYWADGVEPVDFYLSKNRKTGKPCIVYVFIRDEQQKSYDAWVKLNEEQSNELQADGSR